MQKCVSAECAAWWYHDLLKRGQNQRSGVLSMQYWVSLSRYVLTHEFINIFQGCTDFFAVRTQILSVNGVRDCSYAWKELSEHGVYPWRAAMACALGSPYCASVDVHVSFFPPVLKKLIFFFFCKYSVCVHIPFFRRNIEIICPRSYLSKNHRLTVQSSDIVDGISTFCLIVVFCASVAVPNAEVCYRSH